MMTSKIDLSAPGGETPPSYDGPLCVDLDGTLTKTDLLHEALISFVRSNLLSCWKLVLWALQGKVYLKQRLATQISPQSELLPYREDLLKYLREQHALGRSLTLITASPQKWAEAVAEHLGLFEHAIGSGDTNLRGPNKAKFLEDRYGVATFDYIGDHASDLPVWRIARTAFAAGPRGRSLLAHVPSTSRGQVFDADCGGHIAATVRSARPHQWSKNLLLFVPLLAAHRMFEIDLLIKLLIAFTCISLVASATYMINDLLDLQVDRAHPRKRSRPFASGQLSIASGVRNVVFLCVTAAALLHFLPLSFSISIFIYAILTLSYSFRLKRVTLLDVFVLAGLYTLRIIAGAVAVAIPVSSWLLAFSMFTFIALATAKRCAELTGTSVGDGERLGGRGYFTSDLEILGGMGSASSFCASLVLSIFAGQDYVAERYKTPQLLWLLCPIVIFVLNRILILARRGHMQDDPIIFCSKDKITLFCILLSIIVFILSALFKIDTKLIGIG